MSPASLFPQRTFVLTSLALSLFLAVQGTAQITLTLESVTFVPAGATVDEDYYGPSSTSGSASLSTAFGQAQAEASLGSMQLFAFSSSDPNLVHGDTLTTSTFAQAAWTDSILVTASGLAGTGGRLHAQFLASGSLSLPGSINSTFTGAQPVSVRWSLGASPNYMFGGEGQVDGLRMIDIDLVEGTPVSVLSGSANFQVYDLYIPFTFGESFNLTITGRAASLVQPRGMTVPLSASSTLNITWMGITEVLDASEAPLVGYTVASTGDWIVTSAVPEPSTYAAFAGVVVLAVVIYRRRMGVG
ncbi:MAG: PEP-CTERM sorting domain-containing protein [Dechloromonas sp.]|nr:MAG: PEP-CTERM sorting domain-containing protein [Dechloromonas sp.]